MCIFTMHLDPCIAFLPYFLLLPSFCPSLHLQGQNLDLAIFKEEVVALIGEGICTVKTLTRNHLYCEPPAQQPSPSNSHGRKREGADALPEFTVSKNS